MTQEEILQYNKRCADFMGLKISIKLEDGYDCGTWYKPTDNENEYLLCPVMYHSDWNWIMEVVEAIEELESSDFYMEWFWLNDTNIALYQRYKQNGSNLWEYIARFGNVKTKKEAVVQTINQFLIWYKQK